MERGEVLDAMTDAADIQGTADAGPNRRGTKSAGAFRTISEVASELDVPQHVLRFWETRFSQIRPLKRAGGRRYYRPEDVELLRRIRALLYQQGYTIKGVQKLLREGVRTSEAAAIEEDVGAGQDTVAPEAVASPGAGAETGEAARSTRAAAAEIVEELIQIRDLLRSLRR